MYAITDSGYRAVTAEMPLAVGESRVAEIPGALLTKIKGDQMRAERSQRLRSSDWTQMADAPLSVAAKTAWAVYRQALRDLPTLPAFPEVPWPTPPSLDGAAGTAGSGDSVQLP
ncbi:tail fiber assembly protein [Stenotrophomonas sp. 278]|uniref:tail fiber assembly protein n=1 Tax=Stenotrophomonas sp. 278 TaxID=2479851 RepID=UPI000F682D4A|nr:tail fiber assembly protein [Stenotrophomonas sp. 278]RRU05599.1 hypothetical protein EGJ34_18055 [Stenotrophomonas sp. 278]